MTGIREALASTMRNSANTSQDIEERLLNNISAAFFIDAKPECVKIEIEGRYQGGK